MPAYWSRSGRRFSCHSHPRHGGLHLQHQSASRRIALVVARPGMGDGAAFAHSGACVAGQGVLRRDRRVGLDARWYNDSGVGTYVAGLLRAMAAADRGFELLVYEHPENPVPGLDDSRVIRVPVRVRKYSIAEQSELRRRARADHLDVFHSPFYAIPLALSCPVVVTIHDLIPFRFHLGPWAKRWMVKTGHRASVRRAGHII